MFNFGDILEVQAEDGSFYGEFFITGSTSEELFLKTNFLTFSFFIPFRFKEICINCFTKHVFFCY